MMTEGWMARLARGGTSTVNRLGIRKRAGSLSNTAIIYEG
ncbi:unnamed protein product [Heligmosomoides polygyrus]|uniref:Uncharacterized protein n=1 Tax=Heligmosomoides polygyrus TaxID=6339 RepID=A0A183FLK7_HELPZ|nr:unnamed protein product [Heligmosomoides polygyrus]